MLSLTEKKKERALTYKDCSPALLIYFLEVIFMSSAHVFYFSDLLCALSVSISDNHFLHTVFICVRVLLPFQYTDPMYLHLLFSLTSTNLNFFL